MALLIKACAEPLRSVKPVASQIRASSRKIGTEASYFVASILKPLYDFRDGPAKSVEGDIQQQWIRQVVNDIANRSVPS